MDGFLAALVISFGVIFVAELGDKSQLMASTFATRYRAVTVLAGITIATALVHLVSVGVGVGLGSALPTGWIGLAAGIAFLAFGRGRYAATASRRRRKPRPSGTSARRYGPWAGRSSWPNSATRRCSPRSPWPPSTAGRAPGSGRPSAWSPPTPCHPGRADARQTPAGQGHQIRHGSAVRDLRNLAADRRDRPAHLTLGRILPRNA